MAQIYDPYIFFLSILKGCGYVDDQLESELPWYHLVSDKKWWLYAVEIPSRRTKREKDPRDLHSAPTLCRQTF